MKKYISYLLTFALLVPAFVSCTEELQDNSPRRSHKHTVYFSAVDQVTKTGLSIDGTTVNPDWRKTDNNNVHFFEMDANANAAYGVADDITLSEENHTAHFKAAIDEDMVIHIDTDDGNKGAKGTRVSPFTYGAVVAKKPGEALTFVIPSEQHPDAETLKDPDADFLIGYSRKSYDDPYNYDDPVVDLYFDRVAALGRISLSNFKGDGEKVKSVTVNANAGLTGSVPAAGIDFKNAAVTFTRDEGPGSLTLSYGDGVDIPAAGAFEAYFVTIPGKVSITSIEIVTDQYRYTKAIDGGKEITFSAETFKNINLDLDTATAEAEVPTPTEDTFYLAGEIVAGESYMIVSGDQAMTTDGSTLGVVPVTGAGEATIQISAASVSLFEAAEHIEYYEGTSPAGHFTLSNGGMFLQRHSDGGTQTGAIGDIPGTKKYYVWEYDGEHLYHLSSSSNTFYLGYLGTDDGWAFKYNGTLPDTYLYTLTKQLKPRNLAFDKESVTVVLGQTPVLPTLTGVTDGIAYSSSDTAVAEVDASGNVTPKAVGTALITATAEANDEYAAGSASYELKVTDGSVTIWYKVDEIEDNGEYLIVSNGYALDNNGSSGGAAVKVDVSDDTIQYEAPETMIWNATASSGKFRLNNSGKVIRLSSNSFQIGNASGTESNNQWNLNENGYLMISDYYLYYSTNNSRFSVSTSASDTHTASLFSKTPPLPAWDISYDQETAEYDLSTGSWNPGMPALTSSATTISYVSEDPTVASVSNTGTVTPLKRGSTTIKATAQGDDSHKEATASYVLRVIDSSAPLNTYTKVTSTSGLKPNAKYLLVFEGISGDTDGDGDPKVFKPILSQDEKTFSKSTGNAMDVEISSGTIASNDYIDCHLTLESGYYLKADGANRYLYPTGTSGGSGTLSAEATATNSLTISFSDGIAQIKAQSGSNYLVWSTSSHYFSSNAQVSGSYSTGICLYVLDDGTAPGGGDDPTPSDNTYSLATSIVAGKQYLIVSNGKALQNNSGSPAAVDITVSGGTIEYDAPSTVLWTAVADGDTFNFTNNDQYLRRPSSGSSVGIGNKSSTADNNQWYYDADNQHVTIKHTSSSSGSTTTYYLKYNTSWDLSTSTGNTLLYTKEP